MKNKLMIIGITIFLILTSAVGVYADTETAVTFTADKTKVKAGETFTVTLSATCADGINGIETTYSYDTEKLELQSASTANSNFASLGGTNTIEVISNSEDTITSDDIFKLTFKVKDGVEANTEIKITTGQIILDSDAGTNSEHTIEAKEVTITVVSANGDTSADDENNNEEAPSVDDENNNEEIPTVEDEGNDDEQEATDGTTVVVGTDKEDATTSDTDYSDAGLNTIFAIVIVAILIVAVVIHRKNQKYQDIK